MIFQSQSATAEAPGAQRSFQRLSRPFERKCAGGKGDPTGECEECREKRPATQQRSANPVETSAVPHIVQDVLQSSAQPLDAATRSFMEPRFGHDFSRVRVHVDARAAASARAVSARAYTVGWDVAFGANEYAPATQRGRGLLAHELAHTIQQQGGAGAPPSNDPRGIHESTADAAGREVANGRRVSFDLPASGIGLARSPVTPGALNDQQLAEELKRATESLKPGEEPDWWLKALRAEANSRGWQRAQAERQQAERVAAERQRAAQAAAAERQRAAAERERKERAAAVAEAMRAGTSSTESDDKDEEDEVFVTPMALEPSGTKRVQSKAATAPVRRAVRKKGRTPSKFDPGGFTDDIYKESREASKRIDAQIEKDREISKKGTYRDRLQLVRIKLQKTSKYWYSRNEAFSRMTGEEVWREGINDDLFIESEKRAVYQDQNSLQQYIQDEMEEDRKRARAKFESDQYRAWVAQGEQLSSPQTIIQPFVVAAAAPELVAAAYFGTQTGAMVGDLVNACKDGPSAGCAAAMAQAAAALAMERALKGEGSATGRTRGNETVPPIPSPSGVTPPPVPKLSVEQGGAQGSGRARGLLRDTDAASRSVQVDASHPIFKNKLPTNDTPNPPQGQVARVAVNATNDVPPGLSIDPPKAASTPGQKIERPQAMAGKRRVGDEHESNIRPSTEAKHQEGRSRVQREQEAADLRNDLARQEALQSRVRQFVSKLQRIINNLSRRSGLSRQLRTEGIDVQQRYQALLQELSAVDREELETLRTQLRRELGIKGSELDDFVMDELGRLDLLPNPPREE